MRVCFAVLLSAALPLLTLAGEPGGARNVAPRERAVVARLQVRAEDLRSLQESLLALSEDRLRPMGLSIYRRRTTLILSAPLPERQTFEVRSEWLAQVDFPALPLRFELRPVGPAPAGHAKDNSPIEVTLAVALQKDVSVANRRLTKGSEVTCADIAVERRDVRFLPKLPLTLPCEIPAGAVALRDISAHDAVRSADVGKAPDVTAGTPVRVTVSAGAINVSASAIALADARVGDRIAVRMQRPVRTLHTRVIGPGAVQLDGS